MEINETTTTLDQAQTMTITPEVSGPKVEGGIKTVTSRVTTHNQRRGYTIHTQVCRRCGAQADHTAQELKTAVCSQCGAKTWREIGRLSGDKVEKVLNTTLQYECQTCQRQYAQPTRCCVSNSRATPSSDLQAGWYCLGCREIYIQKVVCCSGSRLIPGQFYAATRQDYLAKPKLLLPL